MPLSDPDADYNSVTSDIYGNIGVGDIDMNDDFINEAVSRISAIYPGINFQNGGSGEKPNDLVVSTKITR